MQSWIVLTISLLGISVAAARHLKQAEADANLEIYGDGRGGFDSEGYANDHGSKGSVRGRVSTTDGHGYGEGYGYGTDPYQTSHADGYVEAEGYRGHGYTRAHGSTKKSPYSEVFPEGYSHSRSGAGGDDASGHGESATYSEGSGRSATTHTRSDSSKYGHGHSTSNVKYHDGYPSTLKGSTKTFGRSKYGGSTHNYASNNADYGHDNLDMKSESHSYEDGHAHSRGHGTSSPDKSTASQYTIGRSYGPGAETHSSGQTKSSRDDGRDVTAYVESNTHENALIITGHSGHADEDSTSAYGTMHLHSGDAGAAYGHGGAEAQDDKYNPDGDQSLTYQSGSAQGGGRGSVRGSAASDDDGTSASSGVHGRGNGGEFEGSSSSYSQKEEEHE